MYYFEYKLSSYTNLKKICERAYKNKYAVGQYNINNLEWTKAILEVCQKMKSPVILGVSEGALKYMGGYSTVVGMVTGLIKDLELTIPVVLHLDHGSSYESCRKAIDSGFSSVMFDGSKLDIKENIKITKRVVKYAKKFNVSVEGEVGTVGGNEDGVIGEGIIYAKISDIRKLKKTGVDVIAASFGSVHGLYKGKPKIRIDKIREASKEFKMPLVLHGASGLSNSVIRKAIRNGEAKINVNTNNQIAFCDSVEQYFINHFELKKDGYDPRRIINFGVKNGMKPVIEEKIMLFNSCNRSQ